MIINNEEDLVSRAKLGDERAFAELVSACAGELLRAIDARLSDQWRVYFSPDDALQETLTEAIRSLPDFEWRGPGSFYAWLRRLATTGMTDEIRKLMARKRRPPGGAPVSTTESMLVILDQLRDPDQSTPSRITMRDEAVGLFRAALAKLPEDQRRAIELYDLQECDIQEVKRIMEAEFEAQLGKKRNVSVHVLRFRAFARLRGALVSQASFFQNL